MIVKYFIYTLLAVSLVGTCYRFYSSYRDSQHYPPKGVLVDTGGYKLHSRVIGSGKATIIFDAGMGDTALSWDKVIFEISKSSTTFSYDRAGLGWSEKSPLPRTSSNMVE